MWLCSGVTHVAFAQGRWRYNRAPVSELKHVTEASQPAWQLAEFDSPCDDLEVVRALLSAVRNALVDCRVFVEESEGIGLEDREVERAGEWLIGFTDLDWFEVRFFAHGWHSNEFEDATAVVRYVDSTMVMLYWRDARIDEIAAALEPPAAVTRYRGALEDLPEFL